MPTCRSVEEAEARAGLIGLRLLAGIHNGKVILEMDNQMIVKEVESQIPTWSHCYGLIMDIKHAMSAFPECKIVHVNRCRNRLAHELAALTRRSGDQMLLAVVPTCIRQMMDAPCTSLT